MASRPHAAALLEDAWNRHVTGVLRDRGWRCEAIGHTGYGTPDRVRVLGRIKLARPGDPGTQDSPQRDAAVRDLRGEERARGWRSFATPPPATNAPVTVRLGDAVVESRTDRGGYVDVLVEGAGLEPGWHTATIQSQDSDPADAPVLVIGPETRYGIVSDIDDTVISTMLPRALIAAWNTFVVHSNTRRAVPGMAPLYRELQEIFPGAPVIYVSTGAWNTFQTLTQFLARHGFPAGPLLLTDWGPTNTGWFRSGQEHKRASLRSLWQTFPDVHWLLVGDDGQHDPKLYSDFAEDHPDVVELIAIRELTPAEQVLSHGLPVSNEELQPIERINATTPVYRAPDGYGLAQRLRAQYAAADIGAHHHPDVEDPEVHAAAVRAQPDRDDQNPL
ncbi:App1 family protein [Arsenicicoccus sp. oral taxon 190]|uniref:App1 family protein n=1 Tax=Arsenicicoccus sp. oral taxon 190 TaxID=1658671 RepID=UPI0009E2C568|nr:phosphatase domain-containing protein [Arsenicicoccus sp. oral taxon 190]